MRSLTILLVLVVSALAQKPSPFTARTSAPAAPPVAPVSPVVPVSVLRGLRPKPMVASSGSLAPVSPVNRPPEQRLPVEIGELPAPPQIPSVVPRLKTIVLTAPEIAVAEVAPPQVGDLKMGCSKQDVLQKLGNPATTISMYEGGQFLESLRYEWKGQWVGTVRVVNGRVVSIDQR